MVGTAEQILGMAVTEANGSVTLPEVEEDDEKAGNDE
jgi:hypothetical protein